MYKAVPGIKEVKKYPMLGQNGVLVVLQKTQQNRSFPGEPKGEGRSVCSLVKFGGMCSLPSISPQTVNFPIRLDSALPVPSSEPPAERYSVFNGVRW